MLDKTTNLDHVIENYGVKLVLLTYEKIEMVRQWRNDDKIRQFMEYRELITPEMQESWYSKLNNGVDNFYWIIQYKDEELGLINIKDVDYNNKTGESGVFIYTDKYLNTDIAYRAHLAMFDYVFNKIGLKYTYSHMLKSNLRAQRFALFLGNYLADGQEDCDNQLFILTRGNYLNNKNRIRFIKRYLKQIK